MMVCTVTGEWRWGVKVNKESTIQMPRVQCLFTVFTHPQTTHIPIYSKHFKLGDINQPSSVNAIFDSPRPVTWRDTPPRSDSSWTFTPRAMCLEGKNTPSGTALHFFWEVGTHRHWNTCSLRLTHKGASSSFKPLNKSMSSSTFRVIMELRERIFYGAASFLWIEISAFSV